jgi:glycosyltransferase involved in cell wall biosynthesis
MTAAPPGSPATVSVIIPTYNRSALLSEAVDSVLAQTYGVHEIVIVDDCSDEPHRSALEALARRSPLIRIHALPCHGERSRARNAGLAKATGKYVLFLDDDDLLDAATIASAMRAFVMGATVDVVVARGRRVGDVGPAHTAPLSPFWTDSVANPEGWASACMAASAGIRRDIERRPVRVLLTCGIPINAYVLRRAAIGATRFPEDLHTGEDTLFWLELAAKGCRFRLSPHGQVYVRRHPGNSRPKASAVVAREREVELVAALGREEVFLATMRWALACRLDGRREWWRLAIRQARHPDLFFKYGCQFMVRLAFRLWLRAATRLRLVARSAVIAAPLRSRKSESD